VHLAGVDESEKSFTSSGAEASGTSGTSGEPFDNAEEFEEPSGTAPGTSGTNNINITSVPDHPDPVPDAAENNQAKSTTSPHVPDVPDLQEGWGENEKTEALPNGEDRPATRRRGKLTEDVKAFATANPTLTQTQIAKRFGVSQPRISQILKAQG
jgi:predicted XRE-type DNA-binding protein